MSEKLIIPEAVILNGFWENKATQVSGVKCMQQTMAPGQTGPATSFVNKMLLEHSHTHLLTYCLNLSHDSSIK